LDATFYAAFQAFIKQEIPNPASQWVPGTVSPGVKGPEREAGQKIEK